MDNRKLIGTKIPIEKYDKVVNFIRIYNERTGKDLSISKFTYMCIRYFIREFVKREKTSETL